MQFGKAAGKLVLVVVLILLVAVAGTMLFRPQLSISDFQATMTAAAY